MQKQRVWWFLTKNGRAFSLGCAAVSAIGSCALTLLPNTMFIDKYQAFFQMYKSGKEVPVEPEVLQLSDKMTEKLGLSNADRQFVKLFTAYGFDIHHIGSTYFKWGARIGVPSNFYCHAKEDLDAPNIRVGSETLDYESEDGQKLLNSLVLSQKAQEFALGTQINQAHSPDLYVKCLLPSANIIAFYAVAQRTNRHFGLYLKPPLLRGLIYSLLGTFMVGVYWLFQDAATHHAERTADKKVALISLEHAEGGVEFYEKLLARNQALRRLLPDGRGEKLFTPSGDDELMLRTPHIPLTRRLDECRKILREVRADPSLLTGPIAPPRRPPQRFAPINWNSNPETLQGETRRINEPPVAAGSAT